MILVTGGAGFIGSHLVEALLARGDRVRVIDDLSTGHRQNLAAVEGRFEWYEVDLADFSAARRAVSGCSAILHQAAIPSVPRSMTEPLLAHASGPTATIHLLEAARQEGVRRLVFAASSSAYGDTAELPKHEEMLPQPLSPYAAAKLAGEFYVAVYARSLGVDGVSLRYFNVYGPRQDPSSPYSGVISRFAASLRTGESPTIYGDGQQTRDFTYVGDVVRANLLALDRSKVFGGLTINIGGGERTSLLTLLETMNRILGKTVKPIHEPARAGDVRDSLAALERAQRELGYEPLTMLEEGLRATLSAPAMA